MKNLFACVMGLFAMATLTQPAMAETDTSALERGDIAFAFANSDPASIALIDEDEMHQTKGAVAPLVARAGFGAVGGGSSYVGGWFAGGYEWNTWDFAKSVGGGSIAGLIGVNPWVSATAGAATGGAISNWNGGFWNQ